MFRRFAIASFVSITAAACLLGFLKHRESAHQVVANGERSNVALTRLFANSIWPEFGNFLAQIAAQDGDAIRARPETTAIRNAALARMRGLSIAKVKIYGLNGRTLFSTETAQIGEDKSTNAGFLAARAGQVASELVHRDKFSAFEAAIFDRDLIQSYVPIIDNNGSVAAVFEVYDDVTEQLVAARIAAVRGIAAVMLILGSVYILLILLMRVTDSRRRAAETSLRDALAATEARVSERTAELSRANEELRGRMGELIAAESTLNARRDMLIRQHSALESVLDSPELRSGELAPALRLVSEVSTRVLGIARASIWLYTPERDGIECVDLYERDANRHSAGVKLYVKDFPNYFAALETGEEIAADDAHTDPRTAEFSVPYLTPLGIGSMLDAPIVRDRKMVGVICHEHIGPPSAWTVEQRLFAVAEASLVTLALEQAERREAEARLRESERLMSNLLATTKEGFWVVDGEGRTLDVNPAMCAILGRERDEVIGMRNVDFADEANAAIFRAQVAARQSGRSGSYEIALLRPDGTSVPCLMNATPRYDADGTRVGSVGMCTDITLIKAAQREAERAKDAAMDANRAKSSFLAAMSHEIRTPLNGIVSVIEMLGEAKLGPEQRFQIELARQAADQLLSVIGNVLDMSKLESGLIRFESIPFHLADVVIAAAECFAIDAARKGVDIVVDCPAFEHELIGDPTRLKQIVLNLVGNAVKFTRVGHVLVRAEATLEGERVGLRIAVADTGVGIAAAALPRLMQKFVQASESTNREFGGSGLGLAICRELAEAMGGGLSIESDLGRGSIFTVTLSLPVGLAAPGPAPFAPGHPVLLVAAEPAMRASSERLIAREGCLIEAVESIDRAVDRLTASGPARAPCTILIDESALGSALYAGLGRIRTAAGARDRVVLIAGAAFQAIGDDQLAELIATVVLKPLTPAKARVALAAGGSALGERAKSVGANASAAAATAAYRALVAEDNETNQYVVRALLDRLGWSTHIAVDGAEAVALAAKERFDVILMDMQMPVEDGLSATRRIRAGDGPNRATPIIALTANAFTDDVRNCIEAGMNDHISKPVRRQTLAAALERVRDEARAEIS